LAVLGGTAALTLRHLYRGLPHWAGLLARLDPRVESVTVTGVPTVLAEPMTRYLNDPGASFESQCAGLPGRFPAVRSYRVQRDWSGHGARMEVTLRRAVAEVRRAGRTAGFLGDDGVVFDAPAGLYPEAKPSVELGDAEAERFRGLPAVLEALSRDADLPVPVAQVSFRSVYEGWEMRLQDGTDVLWGGLDWTREKLARLHEALADARGGSPGTFAADLRYFEDGRVLLRPLAANRISVR
jgi:hypothetical protein